MARFEKLLYPALCANNINSPCPSKTSKANNACSRCFLVVVSLQHLDRQSPPSCSNQNQNSTAAKNVKRNIGPRTRRVDSWKPGWHTEGREPTFFTQDPSEPNTNEGKISWWGTMPALDLLKLDGNEGQDAPPKIRILLASSHDIRNMVETIARLPDTYLGQCEIVMNGIHSGIFARNIILLLIAFNFRPEDAAPIMIHLWYSALIPAPVLAALQSKLQPLVRKVCSEAAQKCALQFFKWGWKKNKASLHVELPINEWERLRDYLQVPGCLSAATAARNRQEVTLPTNRVDLLHRSLYG
ncbi:hypothetical protein N7463_003044 [Penicillium fimorum]|uniref:DUF4470 domain-containing protein n=1 Tax=Penicillium fimorum TaxID=1882269 RepID=A0A9W9Y0A5_9EURO|nr:hypothetical protein N7463_003044 [Penicillium fimorum]